MEGEAITPGSVKDFFKMLYTGNLSTTEELSSRKSRLIDFSAAEAVFCCSAGKLIPGKQLSLGLALKFMAGSKKVLTLMNVTPSPDNGLEPYWEKKKLSIIFSFSSKSKVCPSVSYLKYSNIDTLWMMTANLFSKTPMWASWNTQRCPKPINKQVVCYMQNIRLSPIWEDVVKETLKRSQVVGKECGNKYIIVTYDKFRFKTLQILITVSYSSVNFTQF